jgi:hypothetical protein
MTDPKDDTGGALAAVYSNLGEYYLQKERLEHRIFVGYLIALGLIFWAFWDATPETESKNSSALIASGIVVRPLIALELSLSKGIESPVVVICLP